MVAFDVYNITLWNIVISINKHEKETCSLQVVRHYDNLTGVYERESQFLDATVDIMKDFAIPLILVDFSKHTADKERFVILELKENDPLTILRSVFKMRLLL